MTRNSIQKEQSESSGVNVMADRKIPHDNPGTVDYWLADIRTAQDYSGFGVTLEGRNYTLAGAEKDRYSFNGMEKDDEIKGAGNSYDFGARIYDPRIGRWLSRDPHEGKYPSWSPYKAFKNCPLVYNDPDGKDEYVRIVVEVAGQDPIIIVPKHNKISTKVMTDGTGSEHTTSNNYYDFETTYTIKIDKKGKTRVYKSYDFLYKNGLKDFDLTPGKGEQNGRDKYHNKAKADGFNWGVQIDTRGKGGTQKAGYVFTSKSGGAEPTRQKALNTHGERDIGDLLDVLGSITKGTTLGSEKADEIKDYLDNIEDAKEVLEEVDEQVKRKIGDPNAGKPLEMPDNPDNDTIWGPGGNGYEVDPAADPANPKQNQKNRNEYYKKHGKP